MNRCYFNLFFTFSIFSLLRCSRFGCLWIVPCSVAIQIVCFSTNALAIDFNKDVRPILSNRCLACHGPDENKIQSGLRLDVRDRALETAESGAKAIVPGSISESELIQRILADDESVRMPPPEFGKRLTNDEIDVLKKWIADGASYAQHWSYQPLPAIDQIRSEIIPVDANSYPEWTFSPIDSIVLKSILDRGWKPSPSADRITLFRRLTIDLTGLPPSQEELRSYEQDSSIDAYEKAVDRLLASPAFGEHWGRKWLDLARYADSAGYADDVPRTIWGYRDWVIRATNSGMPFDQFTIEQIAGDFLPNPTEDQLIATAFHRNTLTNNEGGTNDEEFRNAAIVDRVNTTMAVWMGVTMACAQCHSHKYDPISQNEYFSMFAILNQSEDHDQRDERPLFEKFTPEQIARKKSLQDQLSEHQKLKSAAETSLKKIKEELAEASQKTKAPPSEKTDSNNANNSQEASEQEQSSEPSPHIVLEKRIKELEDSIKKSQAELAGIKPVLSVPIMKEMPSDRSRKTFVQLRGNYRVLGEQVSAAFPKAFPQLLQNHEEQPISDPSKQSHPANRFDLARWLVQNDNPLTPRVVANRYWESFFGVGIVRTSEEFGSQGDPPSNPLLLNYLASELLNSNWDTKRLIRSIVTSATYRQQSSVTMQQYESDPENIYLARGPRVRMAAEQLRDCTLQAAGLLSHKMYGEPTRPIQPKVGLSAAFGSGTDWEPSPGEDRYRRAIYTLWRRSSPYPSMATFDAPNREVCVLKRDRTNTPLQALVTLNDPAFYEAAQGLARRILFLHRSSDDPGTASITNPNNRSQIDPNQSVPTNIQIPDLFKQRLISAFELSISRQPSNSETETLWTLYEMTWNQLKMNPDQASKLATEPIGSIPAGLDKEDTDPAIVGTWSVLCNVILNLDELLMTR